MVLRFFEQDMKILFLLLLQVGLLFWQSKHSIYFGLIINISRFYTENKFQVSHRKPNHVTETLGWVNTRLIFSGVASSALLGGWGGTADVRRCTDELFEDVPTNYRSAFNGWVKVGFHLGKLSSGQERTRKFPLCSEPLVPTESSQDKGNFPVRSRPEENQPSVGWI